MNTAAVTGLMMRPTNRELTNVMMTTRGRYPMNFPIIPGQNSSGPNAATVVAVEAMTGHATSFVPVNAATKRALRNATASVFSSICSPRWR